MQIRKGGSRGLCNQMQVKGTRRGKAIYSPVVNAVVSPQVCYRQQICLKNPSYQQTLLIYKSFPSPANYCDRNVLLLKRKEGLFVLSCHRAAGPSPGATCGTIFNLSLNSRSQTLAALTRPLDFLFCCFYQPLLFPGI